MVFIILALTGCGTSRAFKFAATGVVADMAATEIALAQPGTREGNSVVERRPVRLALNAGVLALAWWLERRDGLVWPLWAVGGLRWTVAGLNIRVAVVQ